MKINSVLGAVAAFGLAASALAGTALAQSREQIRFVGSSTVYPFTTAVAEQFGKGGKFKTPVVESTGTGGGLKLFCAGVGVAHPDGANASRRIKASEFDDCQKNGVKDIVELKVGFDGIVVANSKKGPDLNINQTQLFLALAKQVPGPDGKLIANPYKSWNQIDASLPNEPIEVLGPPPTSGTRDAFLELVMEPGALKVPALAELRKADSKAFDVVWKSLREDGGYIDAGENDNLIVQKLESNPKAFGIFGYSFLEENTAKIKGATVAGQQPTFELIASGKYPVSRPLFVYLKKQHVGVIPGMKEFAAEYTSDKAMGEDGYLADKGLIPLPKDQRATVGKVAAEMSVIGKEGL
ncbi:PstS family phosphate ABC transporter substrate-binding protein [Prosthecodimorpha staleyi]|uniref:PstS family phosphate ABC transporter substrate-binding protein n=1 Tax=Prosthecodimorpha staleyi TaxID=2840188 RepID=A0A947GEK9_9HYPH|nr:PstS family phosphate ABC transporter substrate-binding protein [Prosthecodimorpha staleyi]MBT9292082.1 PstS family phosphate ABC transporter substrate-binding protein [Prosthecodimorpha staleyi]